MLINDLWTKSLVIIMHVDKCERLLLLPLEKQLMDYKISMARTAFSDPPSDGECSRSIVYAVKIALLVLMTKCQHKHKVMD